MCISLLDWCLCMWLPAYIIILFNASHLEMDSFKYNHGATLYCVHARQFINVTLIPLVLWDEVYSSCFSCGESKTQKLQDLAQGHIQEVDCHLGLMCFKNPHSDWVERRWEGGLGCGIHVNPWLIHVNIWQKPLQYCKVISLQLIKINEKTNKRQKPTFFLLYSVLWLIFGKEYLIFRHLFVFVGRGVYLGLQSNI